MRILIVLILFSQFIGWNLLAQERLEPSPVETLPTVEERLGARTFGLEARLSFPEVFGVSGLWKPSDRWQLGVEAARFSIPFFVGSTSIRTIGVMALWHPYDGAFYLGGSLGEQRLALDLGSSILGFKTGLSSSVDSYYLRGLVGWQWIYSSGFAWGFRAGLQAPLSYKSKVDLNIPGASSSDIQNIKNTKEYKDLYNSLTSVGNYLGKTWVPVFGLVHIGWYF